MAMDDAGLRSTRERGHAGERADVERSVLAYLDELDAALRQSVGKPADVRYDDDGAPPRTVERPDEIEEDLLGAADAGSLDEVKDRCHSSPRPMAAGLIPQYRRGLSSRDIRGRVIMAEVNRNS